MIAVVEVVAGRLMRNAWTRAFCLILIVKLNEAYLVALQAAIYKKPKYVKCEAENS